MLKESVLSQMLRFFIDPSEVRLQVFMHKTKEEPSLKMIFFAVSIRKD